MSLPERLAIPDGGTWQDVTVVRPLDGQWAPAFGGDGQDYEPPPFTPDTGPLTNVAGSLAAATGSWSPGTGKAVATVHAMRANATSVTLRWVVRRPTLGPPSAEETMRVWVRSVSTSWVAATFSGATQVTVPATATAEVTSDPILGPWYAGEPLTILAWATSAGVATASHGGNVGGVDLGVYTGPAASATSGPFSTGAASPALRPSLVLAPATLPASWLGAGDSITAGATESYITRATRLRGQAATVAANPGELAANLIGGTYETRFRAQLPYVDSVIWQYGINDAGPSDNSADGDPERIATMKADAATVWGMFRTDGIDRVVVCTLMPAASSTDGYTTVAGQAPLRTNRVPYNQWLRDGAPMLSGTPAPTGTTDPAAVRCTVIRADGTKVTGNPAHPLGAGWVTDVAAVTESSQDSGKWRVDAGPIGGDGLHPTQGAHDLAGERLARDLQIMGF